ncbi:MAG: iron-sulfur cluster carrier protein ApbC [Rhodothermaceae bacterium]
MAEITKNSVIDALRNVDDPDLHKDLVSLNMIENVEVDGKNVSFDVVLTTPACPLKDKIKNDCLEAVKKDLPDVGEINIKLTSRVTSQMGGEAIIPGVKNTIAVASGKGGVGKSTVAANLAIALAKEGAKVGLIDADIYGPSIPLMFGIEKNPQLHKNEETNKILPLEKYGIKVMSIGFLVDDSQAVIWRGPMASSAVRQFLTDLDWGNLDYLIFDLPPGTGDIQLTLVQTIPLTGSVIVSTPQDVALLDAKKGLKMFEKVNVPVLGIIENMSYFIAPDTGKRYEIFGNGGAEKLAKELDTKFLGGIPIDPQIREGGDQGKPIVMKEPNGEHAEKFKNIVQTMAAEISIVNMQKNNSKVEIEM